MVGELPVRGNGPSILDLYRQSKNAGDRSERQDRIRRVLNDELPAPPPAVPRMRNGERITIERGNVKEDGISRRNSTKSLARRLSMKSMSSSPRAKSTAPREKKKPGLSKGKSSPDLKSASETRRFSVPKAAMPVLSSHIDYNKFDVKPLPKIPGSKTKSKSRTGKENEGKGHNKRKSAHIDLFDAVQTAKMTEEWRVKETPKRNYGEDVADRNLTMYVPESKPTSVAPQSRRTSVDSRRHNPGHSRGTSDASVAYNRRDQSHPSSPRLPPDADWLNQPWVKEGQKPWEEVERSSRPRSTRSVKSLRMDVEKPQEEDWPIRNRNRARSDARTKQRVPEGAEKKQRVPERMPERVPERVESSTDDDSFELGAVTVLDDIFYPG